MIFKGGKRFYLLFLFNEYNFKKQKMEKSIYQSIKPMLSKIHSKFQTPIVFFDLETSGIDIVKDEIIQIYVCRYDGVNFTEDTEMFNIDCEIRKEAFEKHGITKESLKDYPHFREKAQYIYDTYFSNTTDIICGFNSNKFDVPFLIEKMLTGNILKSLSIAKNKKIDVYTVYRELFKNTLESIYERFTGTVLDNAHSADSDILATVTILDKLIEMRPDAEYISQTEFIDAGGFFKQEDGAIKFAVGKHKDLVLKDMNKTECLGYLSWISNNSSICTHTKIIANKLITKINEG